MEMKVKVQLIKQWRRDKMMSQEELAIACGVGLRTIQRVEASGIASNQTIKALAAVFDCDAQALIETTSEPTEYFNVQLGYVVLIVLLGLAAYLSWLFSNNAMGEQVFIVSVILLATLLACFASLSVRINDERIVWYFGIGLIRKSLPLSDIAQSRVVRNKAWWGFGIRRYEAGWLYCVSGLNAVEIDLKDGRKLRIGTDEPETLNDRITSVISTA